MHNALPDDTFVYQREESFSTGEVGELMWQWFRIRTLVDIYLAAQF